MASGRPQGRNDPSLISSLETAVRQVRRPGPIGLAWNWRVELAITAAIAGVSWCVITPHRVRAGCVNAWVQTRSGRLPIIWSATPTEYGERLRLWCPAGITADDLIGASEVLAAACWAAEVRVMTDARHAHLVTLAVIRNSHPERTGPTPHGWPHPRRAADDAAGDRRENR